MLTIKRLDIEDARRLLKGAREKATEIGVPMCIAITDESGNLVAFERMDGGKVTSITIAIDKSYTASGAKKATHEYGEASQPGAPAYGIGSAIGGRLMVVGGGLPAGKGDRLSAAHQDELAQMRGPHAIGVIIEVDKQIRLGPDIACPLKKGRDVMGLDYRVAPAIIHNQDIMVQGLARIVLHGALEDGLHREPDNRRIADCSVQSPFNDLKRLARIRHFSTHLRKIVKKPHT